MTTAIRVLDPDDEVAPDVLEQVLNVADAACKALGLPHEVEVLLYAPCPSDHPEAVECRPDQLRAWGLHLKSQRGQVWVRGDLRADQMERVVVHEIRHDWQRLHGHPGTRDDLELDAHGYAIAWMGAERWAATQEGL